MHCYTYCQRKELTLSCSSERFKRSYELQSLHFQLLLWSMDSVTELQPAPCHLVAVWSLVLHHWMKYYWVPLFGITFCLWTTMALTASVIYGCCTHRHTKMCTRTHAVHVDVQKLITIADWQEEAVPHSCNVYNHPPLQVSIVNKEG